VCTTAALHAAANARTIAPLARAGGRLCLFAAARTDDALQQRAAHMHTRSRMQRALLACVCACARAGRSISPCCARTASAALRFCCCAVCDRTLLVTAPSRRCEGGADSSRGMSVDEQCTKHRPRGCESAPSAAPLLQRRSALASSRDRWRGRPTCATAQPSLHGANQRSGVKEQASDSAVSRRSGQRNGGSVAAGDVQWARQGAVR
jgi:hypothetical protein